MLDDATVGPKLRVKASGLKGSGYAVPTWLDANGKPTIVPGVTTVTSVQHQPGILQWAVDNTAAYAVANIDALLSRTEAQGYGFLRWYHKRAPDLAEDPLRGHHIGVLSDLADLGTAVHEYIEADLLGDFTPEITSLEMAEMVEQWELFKAQHTIRPILVEATVVNREAGYAGTLDLLAEVDGVTYLLDIKTARRVWESHIMQLAALGACYDLMVEGDEGTPGAVKHTTKQWGDTYWTVEAVPAFSEYAILHLRPNDFDNNGNPIPAFCKLETPILDIDEHYDMFLGHLASKHAERAIAAKLRGRKV